MRTIALILVTCLSCAVFAHENTKEYGHAYARHHNEKLRTLQDLIEKSDSALDMMLKVAVVNLRASKSDYDWMTADRIEYEWNTQYKGMLTRPHQRDIGHIYLSEWLERTYQTIELALTVDVCKALHLSDIKTVNCFLGIAFNLCSYSMTGVIGETRRQDVVDHIAFGKVYYGIGPVLTWWGISAGCWTFTAGIGSFVCSIAASGAEWASAHWFMPGIANSIFTVACGDQL